MNTKIKAVTIIMLFLIISISVVAAMNYDMNGNGKIDKSEAIQAVIAYFDGTITRQEAITNVLAYFSESLPTAPLTPSPTPTPTLLPTQTPVITPVILTPTPDPRQPR